MFFVLTFFFVTKKQAFLSFFFFLERHERLKTKRRDERKILRFTRGRKGINTQRRHTHKKKRKKKLDMSLGFLKTLNLGKGDKKKEGEEKERGNFDASSQKELCSKERRLWRRKRFLLLLLRLLFLRDGPRRYSSLEQNRRFRRRHRCRRALGHVVRVIAVESIVVVLV